MSSTAASRRTGARKGNSRPAGAASRRPAPPARTATQGPSFQLPDGSRSQRSPWVWRGFLFLALIAIGLCVTLATGGHTTFAVCWAVIGCGWLATSMWLWRQTLRH